VQAERAGTNELVRFSCNFLFMRSGVPNLATSMGYTNASWTLKCDLTCEYVCRLLKHMRGHGQRQCTPTLQDASMPLEPWSDFSSGYVQRAAHLFPKRGTAAPWKLKQNYIHDLLTLRYGKVDDGAMVFSNPRGAGGDRAALQPAAARRSTVA